MSIKIIIYNNIIMIKIVIPACYVFFSVDVSIVWQIK